MFLLLILNNSCSDGIIGEASDVFGYIVWVLEIFHPSSWTGSLPASCQIGTILSVSASCQIVLSASWFHPRWFTTGIGLLSGYYPVVSRRPKPVDSSRVWLRDSSTIDCDQFCSGRRWLLDRDSYRDSVSRILDGGRWYEIWWRLLFTSLRAVWVCLMWYPDFSLIANLSGMSVGYVNLSVSLCQVCQSVSWLVKVFSPIYEIKWSSKITIKK